MLALDLKTFSPVYDALTQNASRQGLRNLRQSAFSALAEVPLLDRRQEAFRYTDFKALGHRYSESASQLLTAESYDFSATKREQSLLNAPTLSLTFHNGQLVIPHRELAALPKGVSLFALTDETCRAPYVDLVDPSTLAQQLPLMLLNQAILQNAYVLYVDASAPKDLHIHIQAWYGAQQTGALATALFLTLEADAQMMLTEQHCALHAPEALYANTCMHLNLGRSSKLEHVVTVEGVREFGLIRSLKARLNDNAQYNTQGFNTHCGYCRSQVYIDLAGNEQELSLHQAAYLTQNDSDENVFFVRHRGPGAKTQHRAHVLLEDQASAVFQGKILVEQSAQSTLSAMRSNALLLSDLAHMLQKPELEIFADNVECRHGATCTALDNTILFYLLQRGLSKPAAELLLKEAFLVEAYQNTLSPDAEHVLLNAIQNALSQDGA